MSARQETIHLLRKEFTLEFRNRYAFFGVLLYLVLIAFVVYLSLGNMEPQTWTALYWISLLFVAITTVGRSFAQESAGRQLYYYSISGPTSTILSKMIYNGVLMCFLAGANLLLFAVLAEWPVKHSWLMPTIALLGAIGFAAAFTLMSSIAAKTHNNLGIMAILSIPIFIPMLLMLINCTTFALMPAPEWHDVYRHLGMLAALDVITIALALILFPYLWRD
jgi:heme exporter protein B